MGRVSRTQAYIGTMNLHTIEACIYGISCSLPELVYNLQLPAMMHVESFDQRHLGWQWREVQTRS